jgi:hypothetical protein
MAMPGRLGQPVGVEVLEGGQVGDLDPNCAAGIDVPARR